MNANKKDELKILFKELRGWSTGAIFILDQDEPLGDYHGVMRHINCTMSYLVDGLILPIIHMVSGADTLLSMDDTPIRRYPPKGISREDCINHLLMDIEEWVDTNMELVAVDFDSAMSAMSLVDYEDADDSASDNSILSLLGIIFRMKQMMDDYFSADLDPGGVPVVLFRDDLSLNDEVLLDNVMDRIQHGEKKFLTQPEIDRLGSMIAFNSPGTLANLLSDAWS